VVVYPPAPAGLSREKHVARLSLKSRFRRLQCEPSWRSWWRWMMRARRSPTATRTRAARGWCPDMVAYNDKTDAPRPGRYLERGRRAHVLGGV